MTQLSTTREFDLILDFALGMAGRGIPLCLVSIAAGQPSEGAAHEELSGLVADATRYTDRIAPDGRGGWMALLIDCNRQGALIYADRVLERCEDWEAGNGAVSCGIAVYNEEVDSRDALFGAAMEARRQAAQGGGSPIGIYGE